MNIYTVQCSVKSRGLSVWAPPPVSVLKKIPPNPPLAKGGLGGFRQVVRCVGVLGTFSLEPLIAHAVAWTNGKDHLILNRYRVAELHSYKGLPIDNQRKRQVPLATRQSGFPCFHHHGVHVDKNDGLERLRLERFDLGEHLAGGVSVSDTPDAGAHSG